MRDLHAVLLSPKVKSDEVMRLWEARFLLKTLNLVYIEEGDLIAMKKFTIFIALALRCYDCRRWDLHKIGNQQQNKLEFQTLHTRKEVGLSGQEPGLENGGDLTSSPIPVVLAHPQQLTTSRKAAVV